MTKITLLPGDGIGPEVIAEAEKTIRCVQTVFNLDLELDTAPIGGAAIDLCGMPLPPETLAKCQASDAILFGAVGRPDYDSLPGEMRPEAALLQLRQTMGVYANLRPITTFPALISASSLRPDIVTASDLLIVRELTGGIYFGKPRLREKIVGGERAVDTMIYTTGEIERIAHIAFQMACRRRKKVTSVDKANVLACSRLWRETVTRVSKNYPDVTLEHMLVDSCAMRIITNPRDFDVILTGNMFGDILSDEASVLTGTLGLLASASLRDDKVGLYEPVHGSAPDLVGQDKANPLAAILSTALFFRYSMDMDPVATAIENAVDQVLKAGYRTADIMTPGNKLIGTKAMGDKVCEYLNSDLAKEGG
ncbi:MAG: 3-isopropylmalate dehydrogenase [bacterium]|jgi:3-isopropylmalate dehydrogenase